MNSLLPITGIALGLILIGKHLLALAAPIPFKKFLNNLPRSRFWGTCFLLIAGAWTFFLTLTTDLGEFSPMRTNILLGIIVSTFLFWWFVPEFLAVRALGFLLLLAAHPLLEVVFLQSGVASTLLALLAYAWVIAGLFLVGVPYLLRNAITTMTAPNRTSLWNKACWAGLLYGVILLLSAAWLL